MLKRVLLGIFLATAIIAFCFNYTFAADMMNGLENAANNVRNTVENAENTVENVARDVSNTSKDATGAIENEASKMTETQNNDNSRNDTDKNADNLHDNTTAKGMTDANTGNYTATRTATTDNQRLFGMNSTTWIWLIMAIVAVAIIGLVYYYSAAVTSKHHYNDDGEE